MTTYAQAQQIPDSEKIGLVRLEGAKRLMGWELHSGSIYKVSTPEQVIESVSDSGVELIEVTSIASVLAGRYYFDRSAGLIYLRTSDSVNPNGKFIHATYVYTFSNVAFHGPHDLVSGYDVEWRPILRGTSDFGFELDNQNQLGVAIEGSGSIKLYNDSAFWASRYDKIYFENQRCLVYSTVRGLPISEAQLVYRGRVQSKSWSLTEVSFSLKDFYSELKAPVPLSDLSTIVGVRVPDRLLVAKKRRIYGYVTGYRPTSIDQVLDGYPLTGTFTTTTGSATVTGSGTLFLKELSPGDEIFVGNDEDAVTVQSIASNTSLTLSNEYETLAQVSASATVRPSHKKKYIDREFQVAGHALTEPSTQISSTISTSRFYVASVNGLNIGDEIEVNGELTSIRRISGLQITLNTALNFLPSIGDTVFRPSITSARIGNRLLVRNRDFTYSAANGTMTLDEEAEKNVAPEVSINGTVTISSGSRTVTGSATNFKSDLSPGDWIRAVGQVDYFEVLDVQTDTTLLLRTAATYSSAVGAVIKRPLIVDEDDNPLTCDVLGISDDGTTTGDLLYRAPEIVLDLVDLSGMDIPVDTASFTEANDLASHRIGLVIPDRFSDNKTPTFRECINRINQSVFGALIQNGDLDLAYSVLEPARDTSIQTLDETDILKMTVRSISDKIAKTVKLQYRQKEYDYISRDKSFTEVTRNSDEATYLADSQREHIQSTLLIDDGSATIFAGRWGLMFELASSLVQIETKLQLSKASVTERVHLEHEKLYERTGSTAKIKIGALSRARKSVNDSQVEVDDLANTFSRMGIITPNTARDYADAPNGERVYNGYITDDYGMQDNDPETFGQSLIW
jgi:hypothetical protein